MPNRRTKEAMIAAKQAAARQRDNAARQAEREREGVRIRTKPAGDPSMVTSLPRVSVREQKLQRQNKGLPSLSGELKGSVLSKHKVLAARKKG
jgi:hypothetical protein